MTKSVQTNKWTEERTYEHSRQAARKHCVFTDTVGWWRNKSTLCP